MLSQNLARVRARIHAACARVGRDPASITLVAVTKGMGVERMREAVALGLTDLGENRVQEAREKTAAMQDAPQVRWHLVGHLQRNKAKRAAELFSVIHSVDARALAEDLDHHRSARTRQMLDIFLQVNMSGEATKSGCAPDAVFALAKQVTELPHLRLRGLMTLAPFADDPERARPHFRRLRALRDDLQRSFFSHSLTSSLPYLLQLSMGMSGDFEVAIEEGADLVRVGTALFGPR